jgi:uncharacterized protein YqeY
MKLIEQIRADRIVAFKAKENIKKNVLGCLIGDATKIDKEPEEAFVLSIIKKFIDGAKFVMEKCDPKEYEYYQASMEIDILESYRPKQLTEGEIQAVVTRCVAEGKNTMKDIIADFKTNYEGQYDGKLVSDIAKKVL